MRRHLCALAALTLLGCGPDTQRTDARVRDGGALDLVGLDPNRDDDDDGYTIGDGDCNDSNAKVHPGATDACGNNTDDDCDGLVDGPCDDDGDGYKADDGDCNDEEPLVNPGAMEVVGNAIDDDCDGDTDEPPTPCDLKTGNSATELAGAIEICPPFLKRATLSKNASAKARKVLPRLGVYHPKAGRSFTVLSTGAVGDASTAGFVDPQPGSELTKVDDPNPAPMMVANACYNQPDEAMVHDYTELKLELKVPTNARSFSFNFNFMTAEYPEYVCSQFNDKFLVLLDSKKFKGNVSFDAKGHAVTVNIGFFSVCESTPTNTCAKPIAQLAGTGFERFDDHDRPMGGGTDWLMTTSPVEPGETATLRFIIFDEGDRIYDSTVIIDNFQFQLDAAQEPITTIG